MAMNSALDDKCVFDHGHDAHERYCYTLLESTPDAIIVVDDDGYIVLANNQSQTLFGYTRNELIGQSIEFLVPPRFSHSHRIQRQNYMLAPKRREVGTGLKLSALKKTGEEFPVEISLSPIPTSQGCYISLVVRDISAHVLAEQALRDEKDFSEALIDSARVIILVLDFEGNIKVFNPFLEAVTGYRADQVLGQNWFGLFLPKHYQNEVKTVFGRVLTDSDYEEYASPIICKNGQQRDIEWYSKRFNDVHGQVIGVLNTGYDVTERKASARELIQARQEAERANLAKSRFLAAASHDLRQPLQTLSLLSGTLALKLQDSELEAIVEKQRSSIKTIQGLLNALLDISRLEAGVITPEISTFPVADLLTNLHSSFAVLAQEKGLVLKIVPCSCMVRSDFHLLGQILANLVANAIKYTENGKILIGCRRRSGFMRIEVWDTGRGIAQDQQQAIFEEFYQTDNPARNREKGFGLGLAIVQRLAQLLDHGVELGSKLGKGSCFMVKVLREPDAGKTQPMRSHEADAPAPASVRSKIILLIDDDSTVLEAEKILLEASGYRIIATENSAAARAAIEHLTPDLIISDYSLPDTINGFELIIELRKLCATQIPAILVTGDTSAHNLRQAKAMACHIQYKPIDPNELRALIQAIFSNGH